MEAGPRSLAARLRRMEPGGISDDIITRRHCAALRPTDDAQELRARALSDSRSVADSWLRDWPTFVNALLVEVWVATGTGFFWPVFPLLRVGHRSGLPRLELLLAGARRSPGGPRDRTDPTASPLASRRHQGDHVVVPQQDDRPRLRRRRRWLGVTRRGRGMGVAAARRHDSGLRLVAAYQDHPLADAVRERVSHNPAEELISRAVALDRLETRRLMRGGSRRIWSSKPAPCRARRRACCCGRRKAPPPSWWAAGGWVRSAVSSRARSAGPWPPARRARSLSSGLPRAGRSATPVWSSGLQAPERRRARARLRRGRALRSRAHGRPRPEHRHPGPDDVDRRPPRLHGRGRARHAEADAAPAEIGVPERRRVFQRRAGIGGEPSGRPNENAGLLVLGARTSGASSVPALGRVQREVLRRSHCPVAVAHASPVGAGLPDHLPDHSARKARR